MPIFKASFTGRIKALGLCSINHQGVKISVNLDETSPQYVIESLLIHYDIDADLIIEQIWRKAGVPL
jgi:hypothetical protein